MTKAMSEQVREMVNLDEKRVKSPTRRDLLKVPAAAIVSGIAGPIMLAATSARAMDTGAGRVLITCFSRTGTTREVATQIHRIVGGDVFEVRTATPYPADYRATTDQAKREQEENFRPVLADPAPALEAYDTVFLGYPNWWSTLPMALFTFLESHRLDGKIVIPFCTHEGSGLGRSVVDIKRLCPNARILDGFALRGGGVERVTTDSVRRNIASWLGELKIAG
jgi:flavodoxin